MVVGAAMAVALVAIALAFVTQQIANLGGVRCELSCGRDPERRGSVSRSQLSCR